MNTGLLRTPVESGPTGSDRFWPGRYFFGTSALGSTMGNLTPTANRLYVQPLWLDTPVTIDRIGLAINSAGTAGHVHRVGIYGNRAGGIAPDALVCDCGTVPSDAVAFVEAVISPALTLESGLWWPASVAQTTGQVRSTGVWSPYIGSSTAGSSTVWAVYYQAGVTGALPGKFAFNSTLFTADAPRLYFRVAP